VFFSLLNFQRKTFSSSGEKKKKKKRFSTFVLNSHKNNSPNGIAIVENVAYIPNANTNTVAECAISATTPPTITSCQVPTVGGGFNLDFPLGISVVNGIAYVPNYRNDPTGNSVTQCVIASRTITSCAVGASGNPPFSGPSGIVIF